jgi:hypothetical protein
MPTEMIALLVVGVFALLFLGGYALQKNNERQSVRDQEQSRKELEAVWSQIAKRTGLRLLQKSPYGVALHGILDGTPVWIAENAMVDGRDVIWGLRAELPSNELKLSASCQPSDSPINGNYAHVVPTGDDDFDMLYQVCADDAVAAFHAVSRAARQALTLLAPAYLSVNQGVLTLRFSFLPTQLEEAHLVAALELVRAMALPQKPREHTVN